MNKFLTHKIAPLLLAALMAFGASCGGDKYSPTDAKSSSLAGPITVSLNFPDGFKQYAKPKARSAPWYVTSCTLTITGANLPEPLILPVPLDTGLVTGELMVGLYKFEIAITTDDPNLNFFGTETIPLIANVTNTITFELRVNAPPRVVSASVTNRAPALNQVINGSCQADDWDAEDVLTYWWTDNWGWRGEGADITYRIAYPEPTWLTCHVNDGRVENSVDIFLDVLGLPKTIENVAATGGDAVVDLSWTADPIADTYNIYWNTTGNVTASDNKITGVTGTLFSHTGLTNGQLYYYRITGVNLSGEGAFSAEVKAFPSPPPTSLTVTPGMYQLTLNWVGSPGATSYKIYWNNTGGVTTADNVITLVPGVTYTHLLLTGNLPYFYRIAAVNVMGDTALSAEAAGVPQPVVTATPVHSGVVLSWDAVPGATAYNVYWNTTGNVTILDNPTLGLATTNTVFRGLSTGVTYYFVVQPVIGGAGGALTGPSSVTAMPMISFAPIGLLPYGAYGDAADIYDGATSSLFSIVGYTTGWTWIMTPSIHNAGDTITNLADSGVPFTSYWGRGAVWGSYIYFTNRNYTYYAPILGSGSLGGWTATANAGTPVGPSQWRTLHQTIAYNGRLYVLGGYTYETPDCLSDIRYTTINANGTLNPWTVNATGIPWCTYRLGATISPYGHMYVSVGGSLQAAPVNAGTGAVGAFAPLTIMPPAFNAVNFDNSREGMIVYNGYLFVPSPSYMYILRIDPATGDSLSWIDSIPLSMGGNNRSFWVKGGNLYFSNRTGAGAIYRIDGLGILSSYP